MLAEGIRSLVGGTPLVRFATDTHKDIRFWVKLEGYNPSGSVKDRACLYNIEAAVQGGHLKPGMTLLDASSGNMACALAMFGRVMGYPVRVVCSSKLTKDKADFIRYFGAELETIGDFTIEGNRYCREHLVANEPGRYCFLDQLHNPANPRASYETLGPEILKDLPEVACVVGSLGSGGSLSGTARFLKKQQPSVRIVAVEAARGTKIPGTGGFADGDYITPFIRDAVADGIFDERPSITLADAVAKTRLLADQGIFVGYQCGGVLHAAMTVATERQLRGDVVVIAGDIGWKNMDKLMGGLP